MSDIIRFPCGHVSTKLELESARFSECLSCQSKRGQQTKDAPRAALPEEVEAALDEMGCDCGKRGCSDFVNGQIIRAHLHHLTAEVERLRAREGLSALKSMLAEAIERADTVALKARLDALRWANGQLLSTDGGFNEAHVVSGLIEAEIARLISGQEDKK